MHFRAKPRRRPVFTKCFSVSEEYLPYKRRAGFDRLWKLLRELPYTVRMDSLEDLNSETIERLGKQGGFLLTTYHAERAKDPASRATESSRSNVIALWHTIKQIYGKAVARDLSLLARNRRQPSN